MNPYVRQMLLPYKLEQTMRQIKSRKFGIRELYHEGDDICATGVKVLAKFEQLVAKLSKVAALETQPSFDRSNPTDVKYFYTIADNMCFFITMVWIVRVVAVLRSKHVFL